MEEVLQKKKRGRKPKTDQPIPKQDEQTVLKKRGRRPKKKEYEVLTIINEAELPEEELILHIPINLSKFEDKDDETLPQAANSFPSECQYVEEEKVERDLGNSVETMLLQFKNANNKNIWPTHTSIYCWWDCHPFNSKPVGLPIRKKGDEFELIGCFCSYNCACSYNNLFSGGKAAERNSLLHLMYRTLHKVKNIEIKPAPSKEILTIFGGNITIDEFRNDTFINNFDIHINYPPLISIIPQTEIINSYRPDKNTYIPINKKKIEIIENNKKTKVATIIKTKKNTLDAYMNIKSEFDN